MNVEHISWSDALRDGRELAVAGLPHLVQAIRVDADLFQLVLSDAETIHVNAANLVAVVARDPSHESEVLFTGSGQLIENVHSQSMCQPPCPVHAPSGHHMVAWPLHWRGDRRFWERLCPDHGVGHPDPDDVEFHARYGEDVSVHGCCGCCAPGGLDP